MMRTILSIFMLLAMSFSVLATVQSADPVEYGETIINDIEMDSCFVQNLGQWDMDASLVADVPFGHIALSHDSFIYDVAGENEGSGNVLVYELIGAREVRPEGRNELDTARNFFLGNDPSRWVSGAGSFKSAHYDGPWNGVDIDFDLGGNGAKYEFVLSPYADPDVIKMKVQGHDSIYALEDDLFIEMEDGRTFVETGLKVFYRDEPDKIIDSDFTINGDVIGFDLGQYDNSRSIVIDPLLMNSTFIGGTGGEGIGKTILGEDGSLYIVGEGSSGFPTTPGAYDDSWDGYYDMVVMKMDLHMKNLLYATFIGGKDGDFPTDIAYASNGEVVISGYSSSLDFPTTNGSYQTEKNTTLYYSLYDLVVLRLNKTGGDLVYSTFVGWSGDEIKPEMVLDEDEGTIMVASTTTKDIPMGNSAYDNTFNGGRGDLVLLRLNSDGSNVTELSYIGGSANESPTDIQKTGSDLIYIAGATNSTDLPMNENSYNSTYNASKYMGAEGAGFIMAYNLSSNDIEASTYVPDLIVSTFDLDENGSPAIAGYTYTKGLETSDLAYQKNFGGGSDIYICKLDKDLTTLLNATYIGSSINESVHLMDFNETGYLFLAGIGGNGFPVTPGAFDTTGNGGGDLYFTVLTPYMSEIIYSSFIGGQRWEYPFSLFTMPDGSAIVGGETSSNNFPTLSTNYDSSFGGVTDIIVFRMKGLEVYLPPTEPGNLSGAFIDNDTVHLNWDVPAWDGGRPILGYNISRSEWGGEYSYVGTTADTSYTDDTVDVKKTYFYQATSFNDAGDSLYSNEIMVKEGFLPVIHEDLTPRSIGPGEDLVFSVNITDNSNLFEVKVLYSIDGAPVMKGILTSAEGDIYTFNIETADREMKIDYRIVATDIKMNILRSEWDVVMVTGSYLPEFYLDMTPEEVCPLDDIEFSVVVVDNWGLSQVEVEFWTGSGPHRRSKMNLDDDKFTYKTGVVGYPGEFIHYRFHARDHDGNENHTKERLVNIVDTEAPWIEIDHSTPIATTGEPFIFRAIVSDDNNVSSVKVSYAITGSDPVLMDMEKEMGFIWIKEISIGHVLGELNYTFHLVDAVGNTAMTQTVARTIMDNDLPVLGNISVPDEVNSGQILDLSCTSQDNIGIDSVRFIYRMGYGPRTTLQLSGGPEYEGSIEIPNDMMGVLSYNLVATDIFGNSVRFNDGIVTVTDGTPPAVFGPDDLTIYAGEEISVSVEASDNIGIKEIVWAGLPEVIKGDEWTGKIDDPGENLVIITVKDMSNLTASTSFTVTVLALDNDADSDGIPDLVETAIGLDPDDAGDAGGDLDGDGISNIDEFEAGYRIDCNDSDSDGMNDGWELEYGMDPMVFNAFDDSDLDGFYDLEEYLSGTDPTVVDEIDEEEQDETILMVVFILILVLIVLALLMLMRKRK